MLVFYIVAARSVISTSPPISNPLGFQQQMPFSFMMNDPRLNPWLMMMNPNNFIMANQANRMFGLPDPWMMQQQQQQPWLPPMMLPQQDPQQSDWSEMILVFPDGSSLRHLRPQMAPVS